MVQSTDFKGYDAYTEDFKLRVDKFISWWNDHVIDKYPKMFAGSIMKFNDIKCMCTLVIVSEIPNVCQLDIRPIDGSDDLGGGCGAVKTIKF